MFTVVKPEKSKLSGLRKAFQFEPSEGSRNAGTCCYKQCVCFKL